MAVIILLLLTDGFSIGRRAKKFSADDDRWLADDLAFGKAPRTIFAHLRASTNYDYTLCADHDDRISGTLTVSRG